MNQSSVFTLGLVCVLAFVGCRSDKKEERVTTVAPASLPSPTQATTTVPLPNTPPLVLPAAEEPVVPAPSVSKLEVAAIFSDNMVLQEGDGTPVWGWANDGELVTVSYAGKSISAMPKGGKWTVQLKDLKPGFVGSMTIKGLKTITFTNVIVGEVWVCSGQSNMEWPLFKSYQPEEVIAASSNAFIRLFQVPHKKADIPMRDLEDGNLPRWQEARPETVRNFSAVGYYFGRELHQRLGVPVGLIQTTWGGSPAEVWMREEVLEKNPDYKRNILDAYATERAAYEEALREFEQKQQEQKQNGSTRKLTPPRTPWKPSELFNGMVAPIIPYGMQGVIWYQGESNAKAGRTAEYMTLFPDLIQNWRKEWKQGDFPFLFVQLAPFKAIQPNPVESDWAELREAQLQTLRTVKNTGMAAITDLGDEKDIHPIRKAEIGERLALWARALAYDEKIVPSGPIYKEHEIDGDKVIITFDHVGSGLVTRNGALKGFSIAGPDRKFVWARAEILPNNRVSVWSPNVKEPVAARYGWADYPVVNLWNREGLPASPFRTDDFPFTAPTK